MYGYHGQYLRIDVTSGASTLVPLDEAVLRRFLGGSGLGAYLLLKENVATVDPLAPASVIVFTFSPLVGSPLTTSAKFAVVAKSPLTDRFNDSLVSSGFAIRGKRCGVDAVVITGRAPRPSILVIDNGEVRLESADRLWGSSSSQAQSQLRAQLGSEYDFAVIGPAGERQVRFATLSHDGRHAGRGGHGAVFGSKNIKALAVRGSQRTSWADSPKLLALSKDLSSRSLGPATAKYRELGTIANFATFNRLHTLPTRNFQQSTFENVEAFTPQSLGQHKQTQTSCAACTIGCEHIFRTGHNGDVVRMEYETMFALGPLCGIREPEAVLQAARLCDEFGIDTISAGGTIAFAMECAERGLLDAPGLRFGDAQGLLSALQQIGRREGLGDRLAEGSRRLALSLGGEALDFAPQVKGLELPGYEPRTLQTMALGFAVGARGADHNRSGAYEVDFSERVNRRQLTPAAARLAIETEDRAAIMDSLILCKFLRGVFEENSFFSEAAGMLQAITGWDIQPAEIATIAQRIVAAKKLFNIHAGWTPVEDTLPARFFVQSVDPSEPAQLSPARLREAINAYHLGRGWPAEGWLDAGYLAQMGLAEFSPSTAPVLNDEQRSK